jgi:hypothetical protein
VFFVEQKTFEKKSKKTRRGIVFSIFHIVIKVGFSIASLVYIGSLLFIALCFLPFAHCLLFIALCSLHFALCTLPFAHCSLPLSILYFHQFDPPFIVTRDNDFICACLHGIFKAEVKFLPLRIHNRMPLAFTCTIEDKFAHCC